MSCPQADIVSVLDRLEGLTRVQYCRRCFGVGQRCQCSAVPRQAPGPATALWAPPTASYAAMVSSTETTASTSATGVTPPSHLLPRAPAIEPMDTLPPPTTKNLLATASVGRGCKPQTPPQMPAAPGLHQRRPQMPQQQVPTPGGQEAMQATPSRQQVFPPKCPAPKPSAIPSASEWTDIKELTPLQFMPYVARLFKEVTNQDLQGLSDFTGWIGQGRYYHWRVVQQGLIHLVPHLARQPRPRTPDAHPCGKPLPPKPAQTETPSTGASGK